MEINISFKFRDVEYSTNIDEAILKLLNNGFVDKLERLKIKEEISKKMRESRIVASLVAEKIINLLKKVRSEIKKYTHVGIADVLSLVNSRSEATRQYFLPDIERELKKILSWQEWNDIPSNHIKIFLERR